jgi:hypothetical protein
VQDNNITFLIFHFISVLLIIFPVSNILKKAGLNSWQSLFLFLPLVGFVYVSFVLAFSAWPNLSKSKILNKSASEIAGGE